MRYAESRLAVSTAFIAELDCSRIAARCACGWEVVEWAAFGEGHEATHRVSAAAKEHEAGCGEGRT